MGRQVTIAQSTLNAGADYLLAVKGNQPTLHAEIESYFATAPAAEVEKVETIDKDHGRFEVRNVPLGARMTDQLTRAERNRKEAAKFSDLAKTASSSFLRGYYFRIAERYLSLEGEWTPPGRTPIQSGAKPIHDETRAAVLKVFPAARRAFRSDIPWTAAAVRAKVWEELDDPTTPNSQSPAPE